MAQDFGKGFWIFRWRGVGENLTLLNKISKGEIIEKSLKVYFAGNPRFLWVQNPGKTSDIIYGWPLRRVPQQRI